MPIIPLIILLVIVSTFSLPVHHSSVNTLQLPPTGITWVTEPLQQVYNLIQSRFIGLIPGNYTEPSSSDYSTMSTIFGFIGAGVSQNDAGSILSASNVATQLKYQLIPVNDSATGNKYYVNGKHNRKPRMGIILVRGRKESLDNPSYGRSPS